MKELVKGLLVTLQHPRLGMQLTIVRQFARFAVVGALNTIVSFCVYAMATRYMSLDPLVANIVAFVVAVTVSFFLNKHWTFSDKGRGYMQQYYRFFLFSGIGLCISELILLLLHKVLHMYDIAAFIISVVVVMFWNFGSNRAWTFSAR